MALSLEQWIGLWLVVAAAVVATATIAIAAVCLGLRMDGRGGGGRCEGCRRRAGGDGVGPLADGSAGGVFDLEHNGRTRWE